jgi:spectinomycin phosphotransferase
MRTRPAGVDDRALVEALAGTWGVDAPTLAYVAKGAGSYHWQADAADGQRYFLTVDDLDHKPWLGTDRESVFDGLGDAFGMAVALSAGGHRFVVAPIVGRSETVVARLSERHSLAVFPYLSGNGVEFGTFGKFGDALPPAEHDLVARMLARLHQATPQVEDRAPRRKLEVADRDELDIALADLQRPWTTGPHAEPARRALAACAGEVRDWLTTFDRLAEEVDASGRPLVLTHGEPHHANLVWDGGEPRLIDWDTVGIAPPERDLWMLDDGTPGAFTAYVEVTGRTPDPATVELYRLMWTLADLAAYGSVLRRPHADNADTRRALAAFTSYLV